MRTIAADNNDLRGPCAKPALNCIGIGRANELLRADLQNQLRRAVAECGFTYARFHGLFHDDMGVYRMNRDEAVDISFQYIDMVYDALLDMGIRPFVEFGFMPSPLASGDKTVFWWKGNVTPPGDPAAWEDLIERTVRHWTERYGADEVGRWYFECWNEPDHRSFFAGTFDDYFRLYEITARAVKRVDQRYRVGGPASAMEPIIVPFLQFCSQKGVPFDFVSTHTYGNFTSSTLNFLGRQASKMHREPPDSVASAVKRVRDSIDSSPFKGLELHYTEWNSSYLYTDPVHDSYFNASFVLHQLRRMPQHVSTMSYWTLSDIFEESGPPTRLFHGGFGMTTIQGLRKPAYFAHSFLNRLGPTELHCADSDAWVCRDSRSVQALFWDFSLPPEEVTNQEWFTTNSAPEELSPVKISLSGLNPGAYVVRVYRIGHGYNDIYSEYLILGSPTTLSRSMVRDIDMKHSGAPVAIERVTIDDKGIFEREFPMRRNDVWMVVLEKGDQGAARQAN